ncbi:hypothetical protein K491DRAFT_690129 [Lophiostoma macrostomum CBS 122681]|uniref:DUF7587 domain-containing protein n=1 Tax=Lophiostoma macrostomum CBS 122681 TaxID=1314788 RepID=A0A6A6TEU2_9PLEO|nr:hypothetical protein K491DRAFT_690129 [Lophiostoma macrostomum CBS 122681]
MQSMQYRPPVRNPSFSAPPIPPPTNLPPTVYRIHRPSAQTRYSFADGFRSKNQTTIINQVSILHTFGYAHLFGQTNFSSPFISVYTSYAQAERVARWFAKQVPEDVDVVTIDTEHLGRGPVFRADDLIENLKSAGKLKGDLTEMEVELHRGEYLLMYKIPPQAIRDQTRYVCRWVDVFL